MSEDTQTQQSKDKKETSTYWWASGDPRKVYLILLLLIAILGYLWKHESLGQPFLYIVAGVVAVYFIDAFCSLILSNRATEFYKSFMFQTAVPITALLTLCFLSYTGCISESTTVALFATSLGYTTYVVGKSFKTEVADKPKTDSNVAGSERTGT